MKIVFLSIIILCLSHLSSASELYDCIKKSFNMDCKTQLYACTNDAECSYQLHQNTHHIFLTDKSETFPKLYFSNKIARNLYSCLKTQCKLPEIDENYPKTLPFDYCLIQVYDICRGNIQEIYAHPDSTSIEADCYRQYCNFPRLTSQ